jgi:hypothetical protein
MWTNDSDTDSEQPRIDITAEDPYADIDLSRLPGWWENAVREFRRHNLQPFRPPVFADHVYKHDVISELEEELGVSIDFIDTDPKQQDDWVVRVNTHSIGTIEHHRDPGGYSVYEMDSAEFRSWVRARVDAVLTEK